MLQPLSRIFTVAALAVLLLQGAQAADHLDAPGLTSPGGDGRLDINDVYAFQSGSNEVLIMTVNPAAGVFSPLMLHPDADYDFEIDQDGDAKPDLTLRVNVGDPDPNTLQQLVRLRWDEIASDSAPDTALRPAPPRRAGAAAATRR